MGARFLGRQSRDGQEWEMMSVVIKSDPGIRFAWAVGDPANATATWRYRLDFDGSDGTVLHYQVVLGPGPSRMTPLIAPKPHLEERLIAGRLAEHERNVTATLEAIRRVAEARS